jgi:hypothetical protein
MDEVLGVKTRSGLDCTALARAGFCTNTANVVFKPIGPLDGDGGYVLDFQAKASKETPLRRIRSDCGVQDWSRQAEDCASGNFHVRSIVQGEDRRLSATRNCCIDGTANFWHAGDLYRLDAVCIGRTSSSVYSTLQSNHISHGYSLGCPAVHVFGRRGIQ